jgi:ABC-type lipoprotein export system ATPase subunit
VTPIALELGGVSKDYHGLRPLRIEQLTVAAGEHVAIQGLDRTATEVLINLITGATLPEHGRVVVFGRATSDISDSADWLASVDRFGIVSERAVLLEGLDVLQNLALPFTLDIEPLPDDVRERAIRLANEVGLAASVWDSKVATVDSSARARIRVARALALDPPVLLMEHASAGLTRLDALALGTAARSIARRRGASIVAVTSDEAFARAVAGRVLLWEPASGRLTERKGRWFRRS